MTLNVNLTPKLEDMVRKKLADGLYNNASEVIREALRLMEAQDRFKPQGLEPCARIFSTGSAAAPQRSWMLKT